MFPKLSLKVFAGRSKSNVAGQNSPRTLLLRSSRALIPVAVVGAVVAASLLIRPVGVNTINAAFCGYAGYGYGLTPSVDGVSPSSGATTGGTVVTLTGCGFTGATSVKFGSTAATTFVVNSDTKITATSPAHTAGTVDITVTTLTGTSPTQPSDQFIFVNPGPCTAATISEAPPSPSATGSTVVISGTASGCPTPQFRFWIQNPGDIWRIVQDYSSSSSYTWKSPKTGMAGIYGLEVDVRDASSSASWDQHRNDTYTLNGCTAAGVTEAPPSPSSPGTAVTLHGTATCPGTPTFKFWMQPPGGSWQVLRDYAAGADYIWDTTGLAFGTYGLEVDVRDQGATDTYEAHTSGVTYKIGKTCTKPTLSAAPPSPGATGSTVTWTAGTTTCDNPLFRFWVQTGSGPWVVKQDYSPATTYKWMTPATGLAGVYNIEVDVRDAGEGTSVSYDFVTNTTYTLNKCTAAGVTAAPPSSSASGTQVTFTATSTCPGTPTYKFWVQAPGGSWTVVQGYGTSNTFVWDTTGLAAGVYNIEVDVRDQGGTDSWEAHTSGVTYTIT